jgi:hypothetical protein
MSDSDSAAPLHGLDAEAVLGLSSPASPGLSCAASKWHFGSDATSGSLAYSACEAGWKFADPCPFRKPILLRNVVSQAGEAFTVLSVSRGAFAASDFLSAVFVSRSVTNIGDDSFVNCHALQFVAFERESHLRKIGLRGFRWCERLRSVALPPLVRVLGQCCFSFCQSLGSALFEPPWRLATIEPGSFACCLQLRHFFIPASVTAMDGSAFMRSGISSIEVEAGSVSFRVLNDLLVDFEGRVLVWVIGSPEPPVIPSSIEQLGSGCCSRKEVVTVEFERDSNLRSIGPSAFACCHALESIWIPSSVEVLYESCFQDCPRLRMVTFGPESKLRLIEREAFRWCQSLSFVGVPASAEVIDPPEGIRVERV